MATEIACTCPCHDGFEPLCNCCDRMGETRPAAIEVARPPGASAEVDRKPDQCETRDDELLALYRDFYDSVADCFGDLHGADAPRDGDPWWAGTNADHATRSTVAAIEHRDRERLEAKREADAAERAAWWAKEKASRARRDA
jgi:hypothetical protein